MIQKSCSKKESPTLLKILPQKKKKKLKINSLIYLNKNVKKNK